MPYQFVEKYGAELAREKTKSREAKLAMNQLKKLITHRVKMAEWEKGMIEIDEKRAIKVVMDPF